jgi:hypothetical protein
MKKAMIILAAVSLAISNVLVAEEVAKEDLAGVWEVKISPTGVPPPPMLAMAMFGKDGSFLGIHDRAAPPVPEIMAIGVDMGPAYGRWVQSGDGEFQLTFYAAMWNKASSADFIGSRRALSYPSRAMSSQPRRRRSF